MGGERLSCKRLEQSKEAELSGFDAWFLFARDMRFDFFEGPGNIIDKAGERVLAGLAKEDAPFGVEQDQLLLGACHANIEEAALFFTIAFSSGELIG